MVARHENNVVSGGYVYRETPAGVGARNDRMAPGAVGVHVYARVVTGEVGVLTEPWCEVA